MRRHLSSLAAAVAAAAARRAWPDAATAELAERTLAALALDHALDHAPTQPPVDEPALEPDGDVVADVADVFGLDDVDVRLLVAAAGPDLDANIAAVMSLLAGTDMPGAHATVGTALELAGLGSASPQARAHLGPGAPLRRHGLLGLRGDGPWLTRSLRVPDRVVSHLVGDDSPEPTVAELAVGVEGVDLPESRTVAAAVAAGVPLVYVRSPLGAPGASVAVGAFEHLDIPALCVDLRRRPPEVGATEAVLLASREAGLVRAGLVVLGVDEAIRPGPEPGTDLSVVTALEASAVPVVAVGVRGWERAWSREMPLAVDAARLGGDVKAGVWARALPEQDLSAQEWRDVVGLRLEPRDVAAAVRHARLLADLRGDALGPGVVREAARRLGGGGAGRMTPGGSVARPDDLVLPDDAGDQVAQLVAWARHRDEVLDLGAVHGPGKGTGLAALFSGSPGTGKSLAAHVVADSIGLDLYRVDLASVVDKYVGETEKNLERVFHEAESLNVVLFFDEADALFGSRSEVRDARDRYANLEVSYLLQRMEQFDGIVLLATNLRGNLDAAFSRRLQFVIHFPDPDEPTRRRLWALHLRRVEPLDPADPVDLDLLAAGVEVAGGDIRNIVLAAAYDAAAAGTPVGMRGVLAAARREYRKLGRRWPTTGPLVG